MRGLQEYLWNRDARVVTYADDSYVILEADTMQELIAKSELCLKDHDDFLEKLGMKMNESVTKVIVFNKNYQKIKLRFGKEEIESGKTIKVLGILFSYNLWWTSHVEKVVKKSASILNRVRFIRQSLNKEQTLKALTSYLYSALFYGSAVWLGPVTSRSEDWKLLNRVHYQALRIAMRDFQQEVPRKQLDTLGRRATPWQWGYYTTASTAANILRNREPSLLFDLICGNMTTNRRRPAFFDTSRRKIGR